MGRTHLYILSGLLAAVGCAGFFHKLLVLGFPLKPEERNDGWRVEGQLQFTAGGGAAGGRACSGRGELAISSLWTRILSRPATASTPSCSRATECARSIRSAMRAGRKRSIT